MIWKQLAQALYICKCVYWNVLEKWGKMHTCLVKLKGRYITKTSYDRIISYRKLILELVIEQLKPVSSRYYIPSYNKFLICMMITRFIHPKNSTCVGNMLEYLYVTSLLTDVKVVLSDRNSRTIPKIKFYHQHSLTM